MKKRKLSFIIVMCSCMTIAISSCNTNAKNENIVKNTPVKKVESPEVAELNAHFTYKGNAINPWVIQKLLNDESVTCCVDLSAASKSNEFDLNTYGRDTKKISEQDGFIIGEKNEYLDDSEMPSFSAFKYKWLGKLDNGIHVLETIENSGGTEWLFKLLYIRFSSQYCNIDGKRQEQLLISAVGHYTLGDRVDINIKLDSINNKFTFKIQQTTSSNNVEIHEIKF